MVDFYGIHVGIYTSPMDGTSMGYDYSILSILDPRQQWTPKMKVSKWAMFRFHVSFQGSISYPEKGKQGNPNKIAYRIW